MKDELYTQMKSDYVVLVKRGPGWAIQDFMGADDYGEAKKGFELAKNSGHYELVILARNERGAGPTYSPIHARLLHDTRPNNAPISSAVGGFINSIPGGQI